MWKIGEDCNNLGRYIYDEEGNWIAACKNEKIAEQIVEDHNTFEWLRETYPIVLGDFETGYKNKCKVIDSKTLEKERLEMIHKHSE